MPNLNLLKTMDNIEYSLAEKIAHARKLDDTPLQLKADSLSCLMHAYLHDTQQASSLFLVYYDEFNNRKHYTYAEFISEARKTASYLIHCGITKGDTIAIAAHNHSDTIIQYFAAWILGACIVPLNMTEDDSRLSYIIHNSLSKIVLCRSEYCDRISQFIKDSLVISIEVDTDKKDSLYAEKINSMPESDLSLESMLDCESLIVYTSGTTGNPKGVVLNQQQMLADADSICSWHHITNMTKMMCVLPIHHVNGCIVTHITPFYVGASVVLNRKFQTDIFFERIVQEQVHIVSVVPTLLAFLLESNLQSEAAINSGFSHIICGAGHLTCELAHAFEKRFSIPIIHGYGLSETTCYSCFIPSDLSKEEHIHWMQSFGFPSIGIPLPCNQMEIHDMFGHSLAEYQRGEIVIRGYNVMKEYYHSLEANEQAFSHGWFRSGDEGFWVKDSHNNPYFFITGRLKELIIRGGVNLAPLEIDEVIAGAPGVKAGICVGFVNDFYGEEVGALIIPTHKDVIQEDILQYCFQKLPFSKAPKCIVFTDKLPVTSTGKYQRNKAKHLFAQYQGKQFKKI